MKPETRLKKELFELVRIQSKTREENDMREYIVNRYANRPAFKVHMEAGNIFVEKGSAKRKPLIVAHTDTVHNKARGPVTVLETPDGNIIALDKDNKQIGTGGDDKNGLFIAFQLLERYSNILAFFPAEEESGCTGTRRANMRHFKNVTFAIQNDRRGHTEIVDNISGLNLWSAEFKKDIAPILKAHKKKTVNGGITDVWQLAEMGINVSCANIACAYYNPHSSGEYINFPELLKVLQFNFEIFDTLTATKKTYKHKATRRKYKPVKTWKYNQKTGANWTTGQQVKQKATAGQIAKVNSQLKEATPKQPASLFDSNKTRQIYCKDCNSNLTEMYDAITEAHYCLNCDKYQTIENVKTF